MVKRVRVLISGRVQGVFFRACTKEKAEELGLAGWVQNLPDGRVEAVFEGEKSRVDKMVAWCYQGPPASHVAEVEVEQELPQGLNQFEVRHH